MGKWVSPSKRIQKMLTPPSETVPGASHVVIRIGIVKAQFCLHCSFPSYPPLLDFFCITRHRRKILMDITDFKGDVHAGIRTVPVRHGRGAASVNGAQVLCCLGRFGHRGMASAICREADDSRRRRRGRRRRSIHH